MRNGMGRPREHDERTAAALLAAAERAIEDGGSEALSVRGIAKEVGTTTRAVYSRFGSKDGLIAALGVQAFECLCTGLQALPAERGPGRRPGRERNGAAIASVDDPAAWRSQ